LVVEIRIRKQPKAKHTGGVAVNGFVDACRLRHYLFPSALEHRERNGFAKSICGQLKVKMPPAVALGEERNLGRAPFLEILEIQQWLVHKIKLQLVRGVGSHMALKGSRFLS